MATEGDKDKVELSPAELARALILKDRSLRKKEKKATQLRWKQKKLSKKASAVAAVTKKTV